MLASRTATPASVAAFCPPLSWRSSFAAIVGRLELDLEQPQPDSPRFAVSPKRARSRAVGRDQLIAQAEVLGREYGVEARRHGLSLGEGTQAFLFFRARFMAEIANVARRRGLASEQAALLFEEADRALDRVILALIAGHQA